MKKLFTIIFLLGGILKIVSAQTPNWKWAESGNGGAYEYGIGVSVDTISGDIFMGARCSGTMTIGGMNVTGGTDNPFVGRFDNSGNAKWLEEFSYSGGYDYPLGLFRDDSDNVYSTGAANSGSNMYVNKYSRSGVLRWSLTSSGRIYGVGLVADKSGNVYLTGNIGPGSFTLGSKTVSYSGSRTAIFIAKLDSNGNYIWAKSVYGTGAADGTDEGANIITDNLGNLFVFGSYTGQPVFDAINVPASSGFSNIFVAKYDTAGNAQWVTTASSAGDAGFAQMNGLALDPCGSIFVTGTIENTAQFGSLSATSAGGKDIFVAKMLGNGNWEWVKSAGGTGDDAGSGLAIDDNADVYIGGNFAGNASFGNGISLSSGASYVAKYANSTGDAQWAQSFGATGNFGGVAVDNNKFVYVTGSFSNTCAFGSTNLVCSSPQNPYLAKLDTVANRQITVTPAAIYCPGSTAHLPFTSLGTFNGGNMFTAQLSDSSGSFITSQNIGTTTNSSGNISILIPNGTPNGSNYIIRVVSSSPAYSSFDYCFRITIGGGGVTGKVSNDTAICSGSFVQLHASGGSTYSWSPGVTLNDTTSASPYAAPTSPQLYTVVISSGSCGSDTLHVRVNVNPVATITVSPNDTSVCSGMPVTLRAAGATTYLWSPGAGLSDSTIANPVATAASNITYSVTGNGGACSNTAKVTISVGNLSIGGKVTAVRDTICAGTPGNLSLSGNSGNGIQWQSSPDDITYTDISAATNSNYKTTPLQQSTWYHAVVGAGNCSATSDSLQLYVPPALTAYFNLKQGTANQLTFSSDSSVGNIRSYHWDFGDGGTSSDSNPSHTFAKDTTYYVCLTLYDGSNCSYTFCRYSQVTDGVPTISAAGNWIIYPNPFSEQLTVSAAGAGFGNRAESIEMYDVLGRVVINKNLDNSTNTSSQLDVSALAKGMYYIMIRTANADYVQKVVKQ